MPRGDPKRVAFSVGVVFLAEWAGLSSKWHKKKIVFLFLSALVSLMGVLSGSLSFTVRRRQNSQSHMLTLHRSSLSLSPQKNPILRCTEFPASLAKTLGPDTLTRVHLRGPSPTAQMLSPKEMHALCLHSFSKGGRLPRGPACVALPVRGRMVTPKCAGLTAAPQSAILFANWPLAGSMP